MSVKNATAISPTEAKALFAGLASAKALVLAVSGGPDSTALMVLAARWRKAMRKGPELIAVTVDHGLRAESKREARDVSKLAKQLGLAHRTLRWQGEKPKTGLPQAARDARYGLLARAARKAGALHILTAHTLDDQAETVVMRLARGSGIAGLGAMQRTAVIPGRPQSGRTGNPDAKPEHGSGFRVHAFGVPRNDELLLLRPLLGIPKARLIATLKVAKVAFADDPTNRDTAFTRARLRGLMPLLAAEGLDAPRLALLARRMRRSDAAIEQIVDIVWHGLASGGQGGAIGQPIVFDAAALAQTPDEVLLRLIGRAIDLTGSEGPVELGKLEALAEALRNAQSSGIPGYRRTLAGAVVTVKDRLITVETAPPRRQVLRQVRSGQGRNALTKPRPPRAGARKTR